MEPRVGIISPYEEFTTLAVRLSAERELPIRVDQAVLGNGVAIARRWEAEGIQAVVGRGPTAAMMRKVLRIPVVMINITAFDVMEALHRAKQVGRRIAFADYDSRYRPYDLAYLGHMLDMAFEPLLYRDLRDLKSSLRTLARQGVDTVVGTGACIPGMVAEAGMRGILVHSNRESISEALCQAQELVGLQMRESARTPSSETVRAQTVRQGLVTRYSFADIRGSSRALQETVAQANKFARSDLTVLLTGESGTGKELFAQSIHGVSARRDGPFVAINCAALPENLLESELFGYEDGAFTGARKGGSHGLFETAHGGTLLLDEIGEMPVGLQARLLRALQERWIRRVGGSRVIPVDVRVIAATNRDLGRMVREGRFREDLFYRLNVLNLTLPPLRARLEDLPELAAHFLTRMGGPPMSRATCQMLRTYSWPGNIRELENFLQKYAVLCEGGEESRQLAGVLLQELKRNSSEVAPVRPDEKETITIEVGTMAEMEQEILTRLDAALGHDRARLARRLGISRTTLWKKLKESGPALNR